MSKKVEEQKGPIRCSEPTTKFMPWSEKLKEAKEEQALRRSGQTLTMHTPKTGK
jgi:hypothetical protein